MEKIEQKFNHEYLGQTRTVTVQDLTMLSRLDPRINTMHAEIIANSLKHAGVELSNTVLTFEERKSNLPLRLWKWLTGNKDRLKISVKMGDFEVVSFYAKNRQIAERNLKLAHYLNEINQSTGRKNQQDAIKAAVMYVRNDIVNEKERIRLFNIIQNVLVDQPQKLKKPSIEQLENLLSRIQKGERIFEHEKIHLTDLANFLDLERAPKEYQPQNLKPTMDVLRHLIDKNTQLQSGDIGLTDIDKKNKLDQHELNHLEKLFKTVLETPYLHAQMYIKGKIHHVVQEYRTNEATIKLQAQCSFLRIHSEELINESPELIAALKEKYSDNYRAVIDDKFRKIQESMPETLGGKYTQVKNSFRHMMKTGLAHWFFPMKKRVRGSSKDFEASHIRVYGEKSLKKAKYHCTEFVAEITLAALLELDKQLRSELGEAFAETPIIRFPFSTRERVRFLDPARFMTELKKCGAITQVPPNPVLVELIKQEDLDWSDPWLFNGMISRPAPTVRA